MHPVIRPELCIGCAACVTACPEGDILGIVNGKAKLIEPTHCIGHGACAKACPLHAIELVFGTEKRGVDIPHVGADFQTNVPGIYIAGELGGMGLIRNAIEQGRQAMDAIVAARKQGANMPLDVVVIGAGPSGISASLAAMKAGLKFKTLEQDSLGGTVAHFPRGKLVMTSAAELPIVGKVKFREISKEKLLSFWEDVVAKTGLQIDFRRRVDGIEPIEGGFRISTSNGSLDAATVLLTIGRRGTPRKLDVPGEELDKVVYRLIDPEQYRGHKVLVVGGGDSALEAATSIAEEHGTTVTISYRSDSFSRAKPKNRKKIEDMQASGLIEAMMSSNVAEITKDKVRLTRGDETFERGNDAVIICAGGILPTGFLKSVGINVETKYGQA
ncbi:MAG: NAD(P)-binding domain-containing protein [Paracoccaceae bacterium]